MKHTIGAVLLLLLLSGTRCGATDAPRRLSREVLLDKIKGAWAGQMIGVAYGARTEFKARGVRFEEEIKPEPLRNAIGQDDLYVEMTFARILDTVGLDATSAAFFETDPRTIVAAGLACIPPGSTYARLLRDVLEWSRQEPVDWRAVWQRLHDHWDVHDCCPNGALNPYNIDAKLNGAFIAVGLLYGQRDWQRTMEIATRCGQDSDCNPSSAAGVLGTMLGYAALPEAYRTELAPIADTKFQFTDYSFHSIVQSTEKRALAVIQRAGGKVTDREVTIPRQTPLPPPLDQRNFGRPVRLVEAADPAWTWRGDWQVQKDLRTTSAAACEAELRFNGTGVALVGPNITDLDLWRAFELPPGDHVLRLVTRPDADSGSQGRAFGLRRAVIYGPAPDAK